MDTTDSKSKSVDGVIESLSQSKSFIVDLMSEIKVLRMKVSQLSEEDVCLSSTVTVGSNKTLNRKNSSSEFEIVSSILQKNELEMSKLRQYYEDRLKDVTDERDLFTKELLEHKFKLESQKQLIEQLKVRFLLLFVFYSSE